MLVPKPDHSELQPVQAFTHSAHVIADDGSSLSSLIICLIVIRIDYVILALAQMFKDVACSWD